MSPLWLYGRCQNGPTCVSGVDAVGVELAERELEHLVAVLQTVAGGDDLRERGAEVLALLLLGRSASLGGSVLSASPAAAGSGPWRGRRSTGCRRAPGRRRPRRAPRPRSRRRLAQRAAGALPPAAEAAAGAAAAKTSAGRVPRARLESLSAFGLPRAGLSSPPSESPKGSASSTLSSPVAPLGVGTSPPPSPRHRRCRRAPSPRRSAAAPASSRGRRLARRRASLRRGDGRRRGPAAAGAAAAALRLRGTSSSSLSESSARRRATALLRRGMRAE